MKQVKSILEFDEGSIMDKVQDELKKVLENITDINTDTKAREINIKFSLVPDEKRKHISTTTAVTAKLRPAHALKSAMIITANKDEITATELVAAADGQVNIFGEIQETKILKFERKAQ